MSFPGARSREEILALLHGERLPRVPRFSGLINVTSAGAASLGLRFSEIHRDAESLAAAAASSYRLCGLESAVVPADLCVEASALGAEVDFREDVDAPMFPLVAAPLADRAAALVLQEPRDLTSHPRIETVLRAIELLKREVGREIVVGAWVPGPFTLATQLIALSELYEDVKRAPEAVARALEGLASVLIKVGQAYHAAGADFLTVHEMGGSPGVIGPHAFAELVLPPLRRVLRALPAPRVLSVCGDTNRALESLALAGAEALSVDQTNNLALSRQRLDRRMLLFGNIDPVAVLSEGTPELVRRAVQQAIESGADAVWPGCDLAPLTPPENLRALGE